MIYRAFHITTYRYDDQVPLCHNLLHLQPRDTDRQSCLDFSLVISPAPEARRDQFDFFGNHVTWLSIQEPHTRLRIEARSLVEVQPFHPPELFQGSSWETAATVIRVRRDHDFLNAQQYLFDSPHVKRDADLLEYARPAFSPGRSLWLAVQELNERIHTEFRFDTDATTIDTPVAQVLEHRHGVCQDFAHVMIGCLRSLGLAARYVSGYLVTQPPPGQRRLVGSDASHAWVSVFFPDFGWIDFDPTNGCIPSQEHITVGWGRDYEDVGPVKGVIVGGKRHSMSVSVDVEAQDSAAAPLR